MKNKTNSILLVIGLFINAGTFLVSYYVEFPDFFKGGFLGIGIGLMLLSLLKKKQAA